MDNRLVEALAKILGQQEAKDIFEKDYRDRTYYDLPVDKKGKYTAYTQGTNLESNPARYLNTTAKFQWDPYDEFRKKAQVADAYYDAFDTIHFPDTAKDSPKTMYDLVHEVQHARDSKAYRENKETNYRPQDDALLKSLRDKVSNYYKGMVPKKEIYPSRAITLQDLFSEQLPQLMGYESRLGPGQSLWQTSLGRLFSPEEKAMYERRTQPLPPDLDAWVR